MDIPMTIEKVDPNFNRIVSPDAKVEPIADGFDFTEGPVWNRREGCLYFSDIPKGRIHRWSPSDGLSILREPSFKSNGLTLDAEGRLVACEHVGRRISRTEADGTVVALATNHQGNRLNSPNDLVVKSDGSIYFTDPAFGLMNDRIGALAPKELDVNGVWRIGTDGSLTLVATDLESPNGLAFNSDESVLYVDDTMPRHLNAYDVQSDGSLANGRLFADLQADGVGAPDGMKLDVEGNIYCTGPGGIHILDPQGNRLGRLKLEGHAANVAWGDDDLKSLFITMGEVIARVRLNIPGVPVGPA